MLKINYKKIVVSGCIILAMFVLNIAGIKDKIWNTIDVAWADDEDDYLSNNDDSGSNSIINTSPTNNVAQKTETKTVYKKLSDTVSTNTVTTIRHDSDGDGIYDDEDPHPTINENFIVKDNNLNGIDDRYEQ